MVGRIGAAEVEGRPKEDCTYPWRNDQKKKKSFLSFPTTAYFHQAECLDLRHFFKTFLMASRLPPCNKLYLMYQAIWKFPHIIPKIYLCVLVSPRRNFENTFSFSVRFRMDHVLYPVLPVCRFRPCPKEITDEWTNADESGHADTHTHCCYLLSIYCFINRLLSITVYLGWSLSVSLTVTLSASLFFFSLSRSVSLSSSFFVLTTSPYRGQCEEQLYNNMQSHGRNTCLFSVIFNSQVM